jgi:hypothetical protein
MLGGLSSTTGVAFASGTSGSGAASEHGALAITITTAASGALRPEFFNGLSMVKGCWLS